MMQLHSPLLVPEHKNLIRYCVEFKVTVFSLELRLPPSPVMRTHFLSLTEETGLHVRALPVRSSTWVSHLSNCHPAWGGGDKHHLEAYSNLLISPKPNSSKHPITCRGGPSSVLETGG